MDDGTTVTIGFSVMGLLQVVHILILNALKSDIKALWGRANSHGHRIKCASSECDVETTAVILRETGEG